MDASQIAKVRADIVAAIVVLEPLHGRSLAVVEALRADLAILEDVEKAADAPE